VERRVDGYRGLNYLRLLQKRQCRPSSAGVGTARRHGGPVVPVVNLMGRPTPVVGRLRTVSTIRTGSSCAGLAPCRLFMANDLRPSVAIAWERSPTCRAQCERLAAAGALVLLHRASSAQIHRQAQSQIGVSADGTIVARVLVRPIVEHVAHELEHILEHLDGVNFAVKANRNRSGVTQYGDAYGTERAVEIGQRVAREVRDSLRAAPR
jgi:hypothetical protein